MKALKITAAVVLCIAAVAGILFLLVKLVQWLTPIILIPFMLPWIGEALKDGADF